MRHYAAMLAYEKVGTAGWQIVFGQLSASALANALKRNLKGGEKAGRVLDAASHP